jgi:predicted nucleic acid-binding Zn ribbon protein
VSRDAVAKARLQAAKANGDLVALRALHRVREAAYKRGEIRQRTPRAVVKHEEPIGDLPWSPGAGLSDVGSGARASSRDPHPIGELIDRMIRDRGWKERVDVAAVVHRWDSIVGPQVARHVVVDHFDDDGTLTLRASSASWETQIRMLLGTLEAKIVSVIGPGVVTKIVIHGPGYHRPQGRN